METVRDIVVIVFSVTGTVTSIVILVGFFKLYGRVCQAIEQVGRASEDLHEAAEGVRGGIRLAKGALEFVGPVIPGHGWARMFYQAGDAISRVVRIISRIKDRTSVV